MKVINLGRNFCKELIQKFHKDLYCKVLSEPEVQEEIHISEWLQSMITCECFAAVSSGTLEFKRNLLLLVESSVEESMSQLDATHVFGGVVLEYYPQHNCGVIKFLNIVPNNKDLHQDQGANCRLLMEETFSVFSEYSKGDKFQVFSRIRKPDFDCAASNKSILRRQKQLYDAGFRLVRLQSFGNALGNAVIDMQQFCRNHVLTVYQPELVPKYQVENGITSGCVPGQSVMNVCEIFSFPVGDDEPLDNDVEVVSIFPWWDHLGPTPESQVAVVGAGIAGLAAAASLCKAGYKVVLLEAANYIGGRVKQVQPFDGFPPIDLGGEFIHGSDSIINKLAKENSWKVTPGYCVDENDLMLYLNGRLHPMRQDNPELHPAYKAWNEIMYFGEKLYEEEKGKIPTSMNAFVKAISEEQRLPGDDCLQVQPQPLGNQTRFCGSRTKQTIKDHWSLQKYSNSKDSCVYNWLVENSYSAEVINIIDVKEGQNWAIALKSLGVCESSREEDNWCYGFENFRLEGSYSQLVKHYLDNCEMVEKRLTWQVKEIVWKGELLEDNKSVHKHQDSILITNQHGETLKAKYVIISVPLTVLQDGDIRFIPSLPLSKQIAISSIHMGGALKIVCRFTKPFWPLSVRVVYAVSGFISQIWFYSRDPVSRASEQLEGEKCHLATGFATDEWADRIRQMGEDQLCRRFLQQLDEIFRSDNNWSPASNSFINHVYYDWNKNPYVRSGYSSPTVHACGMREELAKPLDDRIFFAGEATNVRVASTVQAAIETGVRAAQEVCQACERMEAKPDVLTS